MSEDAPKGTPAGEPVKAAEPTQTATAPTTPAGAAPPNAMDDAAKAMAAALPAEKVPEAAAPSPAAAPAPTDASAVTAPAPTIASVPPPAGLPPTANTSGMHLQYVAPGVKRQSIMQDVKWQALIFCAGLGFTALLLFRGGGVDDQVGGATTTGNTTTAPTETQAQSQDRDPVRPPPHVDTVGAGSAGSFRQPMVPQGDFTVNATAIGDPSPFPKSKDAGVNKGGYAEERKDLEAAEAMIATNPDKALTMVDQHDKDYPRGIMDPDARMIRIEAYQKKGDDQKALQLGTEFLEDYPHSGPASHVEEIVAALKQKTGATQ
ncbi:MAG TPA: hypothetical protein VF407_08535 [Polyangiaceae bacterium]